MIVQKVAPAAGPGNRGLSWNVADVQKLTDRLLDRVLSVNPASITLGCPALSLLSPVTSPSRSRVNIALMQRFNAAILIRSLSFHPLSPLIVYAPTISYLCDYPAQNGSFCTSEAHGSP
jgi:hypothetical protein